MSPTNKLAIVCSLAGYFSIFIILRKYVGFFSNEILNMITLAGTLASIIGLLVVIIQIISIKNISVVTRNVMEKTRKSIISSYFTADMSKAIETIKQIQSYNRNSKWEPSIIRIQELKHFLISVKNSENIKKRLLHKNVTYICLSSLQISI